MADVEEDLVFGSGKDGMQSQRKLDDAKVGAEVAAGFGKSLNEEVADFFRERDHLVVTQPLQVRGRMDGLQKRCHFIPSPGGVPGIQGRT